MVRRVILLIVLLLMPTPAGMEGGGQGIKGIKGEIQGLYRRNYCTLA